MHQLKDLAGSTERCLREGCPALLAGEARLAELAGVLDEGKATNQSAARHPLDRLEVQVTQAAMPLLGLAVMT